MCELVDEYAPVTDFDSAVPDDPRSRSARRAPRGHLRSIYREGSHTTVIAGYDACVEGMRNFERLPVPSMPLSSGTPRRMGAVLGQLFSELGRMAGFALVPDPSDPLTHMNPTLRSTLTSWVRNAVVERIEEAVTSGRFEDADIDMARDVCHPITFFASACLAGVPKADHEQIKGLIDPISEALSADPARDAGEVMRVLSEQLPSLSNYFAHMVRTDEIRFAPRIAQVFQRHHGWDAAFAAFISTLAVGYRTSAGLIADGVHLLAANPDQRAIVMSGAVPWRAALHETARLRTPVTSHVRIAPVAHNLGGFSVSAGDRMVFQLAKANVDASVFAQPTRFDVAR